FFLRLHRSADAIEISSYGLCQLRLRSAMANHIDISTEGIDFEALERKSLAAAKKFSAGTLTSSMRGRLGEIAVYAFLKRSLPECTVIDDAFSGATAYDIEVIKNPIQAETERVGI